MAQTIVFNGVVYTIPATGDDSWGQNLTDYFVAIPQGVLQRSGGIFTLGSDVNFGPNFGVLSKYFSTRAVLPATTGLLRMSLVDTIAWRNNAGDGDLSLAINGSDQLTFNGNILQVGGNYITGLTGDVTATGPGNVAAAIATNAVTNTKFRQSSALSIVGNSSNTLSDVADIIASTDNTVLLRSGVSLAFNLLSNNNIDAAAAISLSKLAVVTANRALISDAGGLITASIVTNIELGYLSGVTSGVQAQINAKAPSASPTLTGTVTLPVSANRALISNGSSALAASAVTDTELGYLSGVTSSIQTAIDSKPVKSGYPAGSVITANGSGIISSGTAPGTAGNVLTSDGSGWISAAASASPTASDEISNLGFAYTMGSNAVTIALKQADGATDPAAAAGAVKIGFRNTSTTISAYNQRVITSARSITVSAGSTLGHTSGVQHYIYVYAIDNAGTVELAVSQTLYPDYSLVSTTAEGGAGAADSNSTIYSTTARTNVPIRVIGRITSTQTTAGNWAAAFTDVSSVNASVAAFNVIAARYASGSGQSIPSGSSSSTTLVNFETKSTWDTHGAVSNPSTAWRFTAPSPGRYHVSTNVTFTNNATGERGVSIYKNGASYQFSTNPSAGGTLWVTSGLSIDIDLLAGDYVDIRCWQTSGGALVLANSTGWNSVSIHRVGN